MGVRKKLFLLCGLAILFTSCGKKSGAEKAREAREAYAKGVKLFHQGDYGGAIEYLRKAEGGMAYLSPDHIRDLKFKLALSLYKEEKYEDAILEFEDYITYYPTAPNIELAYLYLINSYLKISPDPWRDQSYTHKAIEVAQKFLQMFPDSKYRPQIEELIDKAKRKLVKHHYLIAKFYEEYGYHYPAAVRFEYLLLTYPNLINTQDLYFHYIKNLLLVPQYARQKEEYWKKKIDELKEELSKGKDKSYIQRRIEFYRSQIERWKRIAQNSLQKAQENLKQYKERFGEDRYYKLLLKLKKEVINS
ncbi:MAG TPA: outer membrane protein assembly factor BamD [Aquifex aeolicus]|uniref:Outer membrane protein assembly factor BamD n=1 Tax=Aquifex aeolicus TaxID=63363 RepID=A0A9D0YP15_AQUAO|nr:outer membrane protein assembly factor BamD [Aquificales bacterium]HIP98316.1 outer membrane protein assembly factor BamD [Aquifex aeolicus]HIQ26677.1 outer membrane protein assembly factor BamD [Aquifex aeolicus]